MKVMALGLVGAAALALMAAPAVAGPNLVVNGGFETGDFTGWTLSANDGLDQVFPSVGGTLNAQEGNDFALLGDNAANGTSLSQTINVGSSEGLLLTYYVASDGFPPNSFSVSWDGHTLSSLTNIVTTSYTEYQFWVAAASGNNTLAFTTSDNGGYLLLDGISLETPEPASMVLLGTGLVAAAGAYRRRRKAKKA